MANTSLGFHTFSIFRELTSENYARLCHDFKEYSQYDSDMKGYPVKTNEEGYTAWEYVHQENKGIRWKLSSRVIKAVKIPGTQYCKRMVEAIINPRTLLENNYIIAATASDLINVEALFDEQACEISDRLRRFRDYSVNRIDYCMNIDLGELYYSCTPQQLMQLIKKGNIPPHFSERKVYSPTGHRFVTDCNSFYLESSSVTINYYLKYAQQTEKHPNYQNRDQSENVIRFEVQCKSKKLNEIWNSTPELYDTAEGRYNLGQNKGRIPILPMLSDEIAESVVEDYFYRVIGTGHYLTFKDACAVIDTYNFEDKTKKHLKKTLEIIRNNKGIAKTKEKIIESMAAQGNSYYMIVFNKDLRILNQIMVNPITIPETWDIKWIPNPMWEYKVRHNPTEEFINDSLETLEHIKNCISM